MMTMVENYIYKLYKSELGIPFGFEMYFLYFYFFTIKH